MRVARLVCVLAVAAAPLVDCAPHEAETSRFPEADALMREASPPIVEDGAIRLETRRPSRGSWSAVGGTSARLLDARAMVIGGVRIEREEEATATPDVRGDVVRYHGEVERFVFARGGEIEELALLARSRTLGYRFPERFALRAISDAVIEIADGAGAAVLRMRADGAWDAEGKVVGVKLAIDRDVVRATVDDRAKLPAMVDPTWTATNQPFRARNGHTATLLGDGRVLLAGGGVGTAPRDTADVFDPKGGTFMALEPATRLTTPRAFHAATMLANGKVLLTGGIDNAMAPLSPAKVTSTAEIFDPGTMTFVATGSMTAPRFYHSAARLSSGKVLVVGCLSGGDLNAGAQHYSHLCDASADLFDPATGTFTPLAAPGVQTSILGRVALAVLPSGRALLVGRSVATIFDEGSGSWTPAPGVRPSPMWRVATRLRDGRVLVTATAECVFGGLYCQTNAQIFDPVGGGFVGPSPDMPSHGGEVSATELVSGKVLFAGGFFPTTNTRIFDPATAATTDDDDDAIFAHGAATATLLPGGEVFVFGSSAVGADVRAWRGTADFTAGPMTTPRARQGAIRLRTGKALLVGGTNRSNLPEKTSELYDPIARTFAPSGLLAQERRETAIAPLPSGHVMVAGGANAGYAPNSSIEIYDPVSGQFAPGGSMTIERWGASALRLASGKVLIAGGCGGGAGCFPTPTAAHPQARTAEIYDPIAKTSEATGAMFFPHTAHIGHGLRLIPLPNGLVFVDGKDPEIFDPKTRTFRMTPKSDAVRDSERAHLLSSGSVLVTGIGAQGSAIWDVRTETWSPFTMHSLGVGAAVWSPTPDGNHLLLSGSLTGGFIYGDPRVAVAHTLGPGGFGIVRNFGAGNGRSETAAIMIDHGVLAAGGYIDQGDALGTYDTAWVYTDGASAAARPLLSTAPVTIAGGAAATLTGLRFATRGETPLALWVPESFETVIPARITDFTDTSATFYAPPTGLHGNGWLHVVASGMVSNSLSVEVTPAGQGIACRFDAECGSGFCTDGFCCNTRCDAKCEGCSKRRKGGGDDGTCGAVAPGADPDKRCFLDGAAVCTTDQQCGDGDKGHCEQGVCCERACTEACFSCALPQSRGKCTADESCGCDGDHTLRKAGQPVIDCSPFKCAGPLCRSDCASVKDCVAPSVCSSANRCVRAPNVDPADESLFGCAASGRSARSDAPFALLLAIVLASMRRRR